MSFRIAAVQMNTQADKAENLRKAGALIDEAAALGADLVALPEMFNVYGTAEEIRDGREPLGGETSRFLQEKARAHGIYVHGGSIPVLVATDGSSDKAWNMTLVYDPAGDLIASY
jgi:predicted amidohydrolase